MAGKNRGNDGGTAQPNRFRFMLFEGELSEGNMGSLAQAITTALRPTPVATPRLPVRTAPALSSGSETVSDVDEVADLDEIDVSVVAPARVERKAAPQRKPVKREILKNVDLTAGDMPFESFMKSKGSPTETSRRFLVIAAWFNKHGDAKEITVDHVYTAYRDVGLNLDVKDVGQVFRDLKSQGWGDYKERKFEINDIGLKVVNKMTSDGGSEQG